ncbi:hypothetical protein DFJ58DRAFT_848066 [Suillus subalutaceus]|uniref:uncharacterized protein n=1 Tax=Suillus subalutaceus TaxID=48586 RepID=UPI001B8643B8|nr:uncharacterized protein DFJ58DRAFT_848066 [Suillus subalutaceus]KAG1832295.1 hypothetical protein DFJ58DRAFT_848066 [Suillus subalutaceus]
MRFMAFVLHISHAHREAKVTKLQALFANNEALVTGSEYFCSLLSEKTLNDPALVEFQDYHTFEGGISLNYYGYVSDSDLDEDDDEGEEIDEIVKDRFTLRQYFEDDKCINASAEQMCRTASVKNFNFKGAQRIVSSRRLLITDTAFNTWQSLLYYLYTDEIVFAPLRSQESETARCCSLDGPPPCSPKSMYRLACKIKHPKLQAKVLGAIRASLTEYNILHECSSSLKSKPHWTKYLGYPQYLFVIFPNPIWDQFSISPGHPCASIVWTFPS